MPSVSGFGQARGVKKADLSEYLVHNKEWTVIVICYSRKVTIGLLRYLTCWIA
jgi:hypothetical protein